MFSKNYLKSKISILASMPVAISMLCLVALSSVIGTILQQQQNYVDYVNRFGWWWTDVFMVLSLNQIYSSTWFLLILAFLCTSTSICILRSWPAFYRQMKIYQLNVKKKFLRQQYLYAEFSNDLNINLNNYLESENNILKILKNLGYKTRLKTLDIAADENINKNIDININKNQEHQEHQEKTLIISAKKNPYQKYGYLLTHISVLIIAVGGLFDGNLPLKWRLWTGQNETLKSNETVWQKQHILNEDNPSFRANLWVAEQDKSNFATIQLTDGILGQKLPFEVFLKKFHIDYYTTGMPKSFVSDVVLKNLKTQEVVTKQLKVNHPAEFMGYRIYQASFEDGGSKLNLQSIFWQPAINNFNNFNNNVNKFNNFNISTQEKLKITDQNLNKQLEISEFKALNVQPVQNAENTENTENTENNTSETAENNKNNKNNNKNLENAKLKNALTSHVDQKIFQNVGPSIQYKLRGDDQKAIEYHTYMLPIKVDGYPSFVVGMRKDLKENFKYVYIPSFESSVTEWQFLANAFYTPQKLEQAIEQYAQKYPQIKDSLKISLNKITQGFIAAQKQQQPGLMGLADMLNQQNNVQNNAQKPEEIGPVLMRMFHGMMWELWKNSRQERGLATFKPDENNLLFVQKAIYAMSDISLIDSPMWLQLKNFEQKQASVLQITRSPGQFWVYLGCVMLTIGVFMMLFLQELRVWLYVERNGLIVAMAKARHPHPQHKLFDILKNELEKIFKK